MSNTEEYDDCNESEKQKVVVKSNFFPELLTIIYIVFKLTGTFPGSWWWVFSPFIAHVGIFLLLLVMSLGYVIYKEVIKSG